MDPGAPKQSVSAYLRTWLADDKGQTVRATTWEHYELQVRRAEPYIGAYPLNQLTASHIQHCYAELGRNGLSARSIEMVHAVLRMALRQAVKRGLIVRSPVELASPPRPQRGEIQTLDADQVHRLFESTSGMRLHALWVLLLTTGLRVGEACALRWTDVDLESGAVHVRRTIHRQRGQGLVLGQPKTSRSRRTVLLPRGTITALHEHQAYQGRERLVAGSLYQDGDLVFCTATGTPLEASTIGKMLHRHLRAAGLPQLRVHDLRHTAATYLLSLGTHPNIVQNMLGHSTITLTLNTYSHVTPALHVEATRHMERLFEPPRSKK